MPTMPNNGYSGLGLRTISTLLAFVASREFSKCFRMLSVHKFFARPRFVSRVTPIHSNAYRKLRLYFFLLFLLLYPFFFLKSPDVPYFYIPLHSCARAFPLFLLPRYKICSNANGGRNTKDEIPAALRDRRI